MKLCFSIRDAGVGVGPGGADYTHHITTGPPGFKKYLRRWDGARFLKKDKISMNEENTSQY